MKYLFLAIGAALIVGSSATAAPERAAFRFSGVVKTVCRVSFDQEGTFSDNRIAFGSVQQTCNSRNGFRVVMQHPADMAGAVFVIDGQRIPLSPGNETVIIDRNRPTFASQTAELDLGEAHMAPPALSFRVEPKSVVY